MKDYNLKDIFNDLPDEEQQQINHIAAEMKLEIQLHKIREALEISQQELANALNISQPSVVAMEKRGNDIKLSSIKRYVEAMGGVLNLSVDLPTGKRISFQI